MAHRPFGTISFPKEVVEDIYTRFYCEVPQSEQEDVYAFCGRLHQAHWYYKEKWATTDHQRRVNLRSFAKNIVPLLDIAVPPGDVTDHISHYRAVRAQIPRCGAILVNEDFTQVLLVKDFGRQQWGFPKGKIHDGEAPEKCAAREVLEETGYDISPKVDADDYIERTIGPQPVRMYVIPGVPSDTEFSPSCGLEISEVKWFSIDELPAHKHDWHYDGRHGPANKFFMAMPFIRELEIWVQRHFNRG